MQKYPHIENLIDDFALFDDWEERYAYLIDMGKALPHMEEGMKNDQTIVPGCTSRVWMMADIKDDRLFFLADSDAHIVRGLIGVLARVYHDRPVNVLKDVDMKEVFKRIGLEKHLSPNRRNGFFSMVEKLQLAAAASGSTSTAL